MTTTNPPPDTSAPPEPVDHLQGARKAMRVFSSMSAQAEALLAAGQLFAPESAQIRRMQDSALTQARAHALVSIAASLADDDEVNRLRGHSVVLNTIGYAVAEALGLVADGADYRGNPQADVRQVIVERERARGELAGMRWEWGVRWTSPPNDAEWSTDEDAARCKSALFGDEAVLVRRRVGPVEAVDVGPAGA